LHARLFDDLLATPFAKPLAAQGVFSTGAKLLTVLLAGCMKTPSGFTREFLSPPHMLAGKAISYSPMLPEFRDGEVIIVDPEKMLNRVTSPW